MATEKASFRISELCRALAVSPSGFYAWVQRPPSVHTRRDRQLKVLVRASFAASKQRYGSPRIYEDLLEQQERVSRKRVIRFMQEDALKARVCERDTALPVSGGVITAQYIERYLCRIISRTGWFEWDGVDAREISFGLN